MERLQSVGVKTVSIEPDGAVIAFRDEANLDEFRRGVRRYMSGPSPGYKSTNWDVVELIEVDEMRRWELRDRIGVRLAEQIGREGQDIDRAAVYVVDVELWHRGTRDLARASLAELRRLVADNPTREERVRDEFVGDSLCLAKISVTGAKLHRLLDLDVVAEADLPPVPVFDRVAAQRVTGRDIPRPAPPPENGPRLCVVDSGTTSGHPLMRNHVGHAEAMLPSGTSPNDAHGHGTMVGGLAIFGDIRAAYSTGLFSSPITLFSARVLNDRNEFDDERLIVTQMRQAIEFFKARPHNCRVFNLSLGTGDPWLRDNRRQSVWAECLDNLAREHKVLLVVSAGNHQLGTGNNARDAETALANYPNYLFSPDCGLCDPATAAIPLTVGGIADQDVPAVRRGNDEEILRRTVARAGEPTSTTRIGPGLNDAIKPEFVAPAGNWVFDGLGSSLRSVREDAGVAVMSFSHQWTRGLFAFDVGTSFAAARVARAAALVWQELRNTLGTNPDPNLVRAVLATAADVPQPLLDRIRPRGDEAVQDVCGYGLIDEDLALDSGDRRVTLVEQGMIPIDSFLVFAVPMPETFLRAEGKKRVIVTLAFDPPVRRRRAQYLGVEMNATLIRGKTLDEVVDAYRAVARQERQAAQGAFRAPYKCPLEPGPTKLATSTLQRSEWRFQHGGEYGDTCYLVIRAERNWAPESVTHQDFGIAVSLVTRAETELYARVRERVGLRVRLRQRSRG